MGPGGRRPSHPSAKNQITPTSGLVNRQANHLVQNLVALPQSCEGPSECNEATRLGLQCEGTPPQCNGGFFTRRLVESQRWAPIGLPSLGKWRSSSGRGRECGDALNLQYSFLINFFFEPCANAAGPSTVTCQHPTLRKHTDKHRVTNIKQNFKSPSTTSQPPPVMGLIYMKK